MSSARFESSGRKWQTHSTAGSKTMYLATADAKQIAHCQLNLPRAIDPNVGSYPVKHHYPSPIVSWIEDLSSFSDVSFSDNAEYVDDQSRPSVGQSSASNNLHDMQISVRLTDEFMELAKENTSNNLETCGILGASFSDGTYYVTMLIIPKQDATAHSTHPSQTCFLSSIDLHTQYSYQVMFPEAVAIVAAPTDPTRQELWNIQADRSRRDGCAQGVQREWVPHSPRDNGWRSNI
ncbi:AMSH-like ubiquitin thioesterase 2 isoform X4 [Brachypodium distachyon]|uniref:AMSH-like ubiquitin thioesterase 2 isoform X4 n=1 Tax=Brachypodium distachyon TaxID=15368 RepID=UPI000D0D4220|nr:AMSH-like ubiquitin thioesterase 2 isoform X4 [Brachypodium distachyon]|eukprot:XP_024314813.1 AMSH-like ubiquitin thioesterase 2 isoform X4 [Brachypodium distachyon]